ncbi:MAG: hypothetical protein AAFV87_08990, partial [Pseudomonadota bacterium]
ALNRRIAEHDLQVLIGHTDYRSDREEKVVEAMLRRRPEAIVLIVFRAGTLVNHLRNGEKVSRPFAFEGIGNQRFHLFPEDMQAREDGWNRALDLAGAAGGRLQPGAREVVMTSLAATDIERCIKTEGIGMPPCAEKEDLILKAMLDDTCTMDQIEQEFRQLVETGND